MPLRKSKKIRRDWNWTDSDAVLDVCSLPDHALQTDPLSMPSLCLCTRSKRKTCVNFLQ